MFKRVPKTFKNHPQFTRYLELWHQDESSFVFVPLAALLREQGYLKEAQEVCAKGLSHHPDSVSGRLILASVYWDLGNKKEADRLAREILEVMPHHDEARRFLEVKAPSLSPKKPGVSSYQPVAPWHTATMVDILLKQGADDEAVHILRGLLNRDPKNRALRKRLKELERNINAMSQERKPVVTYDEDEEITLYENPSHTRS